MSFQRSQYDSYWRLRKVYAGKALLRCKLHRAGYKLKTKLNKAQLVELLQKKDLGYICYDTCPLEEIAKFATDRRLIDRHTYATHRSLVDKLRESDNSPTFPKILNLSAELRNEIYRFYIGEFKDVLVLPSQPPLARTCRLLRCEVLPIFYSQCTFHIRFSGNFSDMDGLSSIPTRLRLNDDSEKFLCRLAPGAIGNIRKLCLRFGWPCTEMYSDYRTIWTCTIDLGPLSKDFSITSQAGKAGEKYRDPKTHAIKQELTKVLHKIKARERGGKLKLDDIFAFRKAAEVAWDNDNESG